MPLGGAALVIGGEKFREGPNFDGVLPALLEPRVGLGVLAGLPVVAKNILMPADNSGVSKWGWILTSPRPLLD